MYYQYPTVGLEKGKTIMSNKITIKGTPITGGLTDNLKTKKQKELFSTVVRPTATPKVLNAKFYKNLVQDVDVNVPSLINRDTEVANLIKVIKQTGGFDIRCWNRPKVAKVLPDADLFLFDGDHSRAIYKHFFPNAKKMPCDIVEVESRADVHNLFVRYNAKCKTAIKAEEVFVHEYHAGEPDAIELAEKLSGAGLQIYCSHEPGGVVGDALGMRVKVGAAKKAFALQEEALKRNPKLGTDDAVFQATTLLKDAGLTPSREDLVPAELLGALTIILSLNPTLRGDEHDAIIFRNWMSGKLANDSPKQVSNNFKSVGGNVVNWSEYSTAVGIIKGLMQEPTPIVLRGLKNCYDTRLMTRYFGPDRNPRKRWTSRKKSA